MPTNVAAAGQPRDGSARRKTLLSITVDLPAARYSEEGCQRRCCCVVVLATVVVVVVVIAVQAWQANYVRM